MHWGDQDWPCCPYPATSAFTEDHAGQLLQVLDGDSAWPSSRLEGYVVEPAVVFAWALPDDQVIGWGHDLPAELTRRCEQAAPLLSLLAGE
jgi:hypothetical protein